MNGFLFSPGPSDTVIYIMHPREILATHYVSPETLAAGRAVFTQTSRSNTSADTTSLVGPSVIDRLRFASQITSGAMRSGT